VTSFYLKPKKSDPSHGVLKVHGVFADAGWAGVDPRQSGVNLGVQRGGGQSTCCNIAPEHWMKRGPTTFKFWDMHGIVCPPLSDMRIIVSPEGRATFRFYAPRVDLTAPAAPDVVVGAIVGDRCSFGSLSVATLRQKKNGALVYP
jgi:hypothetical protein